VDCGKPLTKAAAFRQAAAAVTAAAQSASPGAATHAPAAARPSPCPHCGAPLAAAAPRSHPNLQLTLVRLDETGRELERFPCAGPETTIGLPSSASASRPLFLPIFQSTPMSSGPAANGWITNTLNKVRERR
jgi:hypothetical protein